ALVVGPRILLEAPGVSVDGLLNGGVADAMQAHLPAEARSGVHHVLQFRIREAALAAETRLALVVRQRPGGGTGEATVGGVFADGSDANLDVAVSRMIRELLQALRTRVARIHRDARNVVLRRELLEAPEGEV